LPKEKVREEKKFNLDIFNDNQVIRNSLPEKYGNTFNGPMITDLDRANSEMKVTTERFNCITKFAFATSIGH
jgi:hypothetical protein